MPHFYGFVFCRLGCREKISVDYPRFIEVCSFPQCQAIGGHVTPQRTKNTDFLAVATISIVTHALETQLLARLEKETIIIIVIIYFMRTTSVKC